MENLQRYELVGASLVFTPVGHNEIPHRFSCGGYEVQLNDGTTLMFDFDDLTAFNRTNMEDKLVYIDVKHENLEMFFRNSVEIDCTDTNAYFTGIPEVFKVNEVYYEASSKNETDDLEFDCSEFVLMFEEETSKALQEKKII